MPSGLPTQDSSPEHDEDPLLCPRGKRAGRGLRGASGGLLHSAGLFTQPLLMPAAPDGPRIP